jgi:hypothetical protein
MVAKYFTFVNEKPSPILWCDLFEKRAYTPKPGSPGKPGEPKFSAQIILDVGSPDHNALKALFIECARNDPQFAATDLKTLGKPWDLGDNINAEAAAKGKPVYDFLKGKVLLIARTQKELALAYQEGGKLVEVKNDLQLAEFKKRYFSGVLAHISVNLKTYAGFGGGITAYLQQVFIAGGGVKLSGGPAPSETFSKYVGRVTNEDPTKNPLDDEIPF